MSAQTAKGEGVILIHAAAGRGARRLICKLRGHKDRNYGVFFWIKIEGQAWKMVQLKRGLNVCRRCGCHEAAKVRKPPKQTYFDAACVMKP